MYIVESNNTDPLEPGLHFVGPPESVALVNESLLRLAVGAFASGYVERGTVEWVTDRQLLSGESGASTIPREQTHHVARIVEH